MLLSLFPQRGSERDEKKTIEEGCLILCVHSSIDDSLEGEVDERDGREEEGTKENE